MRYDPAATTSQALLQITSTAQVSASISPDGQWVLMLSQASGQAAIQIVRVDGQHLQTLYCAPAGDSFAGAQLSPNQHVLAFTQVNQDESQSILSVLDLTTGQVRTVLSPQASGYPQSTDVQATSTWAPLLAHVSSLASDTPLNPLPSQHALTFTPLTWINNSCFNLSPILRQGKRSWTFPGFLNGILAIPTPVYQTADWAGAYTTSTLFPVQNV